MDKHELPTPLNVQEQLLYGISMRLNVLIDQLSSIVGHIAQSSTLGIEEGTLVVEQDTSAKPKRTKRVV